MTVLTDRVLVPAHVPALLDHDHDCEWVVAGGATGCTCDARLPAQPHRFGPNRFLADVVRAADDRGWQVLEWRGEGRGVEIRLQATRRLGVGHLPELTIRTSYGLGLEEEIARLPRGDGDPPT